MRIAFKEWTAICRALASGRQSIILRKGGISELDGKFLPEHDAFLLYPTHFHEQQQAGIVPGYLSECDDVYFERPAPGQILFSHFARVSSVRYCQNLDEVLSLEGLHVWTPQLITQRFQYRTPGIYVLIIRVYQLLCTTTVTERSEYAGCKSWVELVDDVPTDAAVPVMSDNQFEVYTSRMAITQ